MSFFDGINFAVAGVASDVVGGAAVGAAASAVGGTGGAVTMDRDEMTAFLQKVKQTQGLCQQQVLGATYVQGSVTPPAQDPGSIMVTNAVTAARDARNQYLQQQLEMYNELVAKLEKALGLTVESDQQAADAVNQAAGGGKFS